MSPLERYVSELCDKYAHFGEFMRQEIADLGKRPFSKKLKEVVSADILYKVYTGKSGVGPASSAAFGAYLDAPADHYMKLSKMFSAEKKRRAAL